MWHGNTSTTAIWLGYRERQRENIAANRSRINSLENKGMIIIEDINEGKSSNRWIAFELIWQQNPYRQNQTKPVARQRESMSNHKLQKTPSILSDQDHCWVQNFEQNMQKPTNSISILTGQPIQHREWRSHSAGMWYPRAAGVPSITISNSSDCLSLSPGSLDLLRYEEWIDVDAVVLVRRSPRNEVCCFDYSCLTAACPISNQVLWIWICFVLRDLFIYYLLSQVCRHLVFFFIIKLIRFSNININFNIVQNNISNSKKYSLYVAAP